MPLRSTKTERGGVKAKPANPGPLGRPKSPLPAQACGPPHPPEAPGLPAAPQHGTASRPLPWQRPARPLSRSRLWALGSGLKRPWPRALRMSEGPQGSLCCHRWGNPFQGRVPAAWPHPLNHFCTQAPSLLTHTAPEVGGGCGGGPTPPAPTAAGSARVFPTIPGPAPCPSLCLIVHSPPGSPAAGRQLRRLPTELLAGESGRLKHPAPHSPALAGHSNRPYSD